MKLAMKSWGRYEVRDACDLAARRQPVSSWDDLDSAVEHADERRGWVATREGGDVRPVHAAADIDLGDLEDGILIAGRRGRDARDRARRLADELADLRSMEAPSAGHAAAVVLRALHAELPAGVPLGLSKVVSADYANPREIRAVVEMLDGERGNLTVRQVGRTWVTEWEPLASGAVWSLERRGKRHGWTDGRRWAA